MELVHRFWMFDTIFLPFTVVFMKSKQDILSGVSKLDDLLMVSVFQKNKFQKGNNHKSIKGNSIDSTSSSLKQLELENR
jgi:hypothetical protein